MENNKHGFTLIEIVFAITILLAGMVPIFSGMKYMLQRNSIDDKAIALVADINNCVCNSWDTKTIPVKKTINTSGSSRNIYSITRPDDASKFSAQQSNTDVDNANVYDFKGAKMVLTTVGIGNHYSLPEGKQALAFCYKIQENTDKK